MSIFELGFIPLEIDEAVANTSFSEDIFRVGGIFLNLLAQVVDIQPDIMGFVPIFVSPHLGQNLIVGEHPTCILNKVVKQSIFSGPQLHQTVFNPDFVPVEINIRAIVNLDQSVRAGTRHFGPAQYGPDTADQLSWTEGLCDVVIRA